MTPTNILIVDDDIGDRKLIRRLLLKLHPSAKLHEAESAERALEFADVPIDVAFIDYLLPSSSGLDLMNQFSDIWPHALAFIMTGQGDEEVAKSAILAGAGDYIAKSAITAPALKRMIANGMEVANMRWRIEEHQNELLLFSDVLVHDLRAPIRAIRFLSDQIMEDYEAGDMDEVSREFGLMKNSVQKLSDLIEQLASHIRPETTGVAALVSVDSMYDDLQTILAHDIIQADAQIEWQSGDLYVYCFAPEVMQILQNLIGNSIKYCCDTRPKIKVTAVPLDTGIQISVADNGIGVPAEYQKRIFEPFKRLQQTSDLPGSGLGLATCAKIAKRHNGKIWCDPEVQSGTTIHFTLDLEATDTKMLPPALGSVRRPHA